MKYLIQYKKMLVRVDYNLILNKLIIDEFYEYKLCFPYIVRDHLEKQFRQYILAFEGLATFYVAYKPTCNMVQISSVLHGKNWSER